MHKIRSKNGKNQMEQIAKWPSHYIKSHKGLKSHYIRIKLRKRQTLQINSTNSKGEGFFHHLVL